MADPLSVWTVYDHPLDYPGGYIARRHEAHADGCRPTEDTITAPTLQEIRDYMDLMGLACMPREVGDDPCIVESWI